MINLELVVAIVKYKTIMHKPRHGLCSRYLASLEEGTIIKVNLESNDKFYSYARENPDLPIIMIAPGTGVAPCRALIWERAEERKRRAEQSMQEFLERRSQELHGKVYDKAQQYLTEKQGGVKEDNWAFSPATWPLKRDLVLTDDLGLYGEDSPPPPSKRKSLLAKLKRKSIEFLESKESKETKESKESTEKKQNKEIVDFHPGDPEDNEIAFGGNYLFFGNRNKEADFHFKKEWADGNLRVQVFTAFSRDHHKKRYIQEEIRKQGKLIWKLLQNGAIVYVCGSSGGMPTLVKQALMDVIMKYGAGGGVCEEGREWAREAFKKYEERGTFIQETW
jgi:hypothetical protein